MMKLTFEQVVEYLESGRDDPAIEQQISDDPDGVRLREEATLFLELLSDRAADAEGDDSPDVEVAGSADALHLKASLSLADADDIHFDYRRTRQTNPKAAMLTAKLASRAAGRVRDLGVLEIVPRGPGFEFRHHPDSKEYRMRQDFDDMSSLMAASKEETSSPRVEDQFRSDDMKSLFSRRRQGSERRIRGGDLEITLPDPDVYVPHGQIRLEMRDVRLGIPARGLELIFMPDDGPYSRHITSSKGIVELPVPDRSGVLRLETSQPQMIRIELKIS